MANRTTESVKRDPRIGLVMCVRDEARALPDHLDFHRAIGVERAYVFLDRCRDDSASIVEARPWASGLRIEHDHDFLSVLQKSCCREALSMARDDGLDWLLHIDPDEFAWGDNGVDDDLVEDANLQRMLSQVAEGTEQVRLATREAVPVRGEQSPEAWRQRYFQHGDHRIVRDVLDPMSGEMRRLQKWIGHCMGKSLLRTDVDAAPDNPHWWTRSSDGGPLRTERRGHHYHFLFTDPAGWQRKYRRLAEEPSVWPNGNPVLFPKQAWKEASLLLDDDAARRYYEEWVCIAAEDAACLAREGQLLRDPRVAALIQGLRSAPEEPALATT